jgi:putative oxidoreductase
MNSRSYIAPVGRVLLALIFVLSGINKLAHWSETASYMAATGLPVVPILLAIAVIIELACGVFVMIGYRTDVSALILFLYLVPVTLLFHNFWSYHGMEAQMQMVNFLKNLSIMGGLLSLAAASPTHVSVDEARARRHPPGATPSRA